MTRRPQSGAGFVGASPRKAGPGRQPFNFYPTPREASVPFVRRELARIRAIAGPRRRVCEPASGADDLVRVLEEFGLGVAASDIRPRGRGLQLDFRDMVDPPAKVMITNPPFEDLVLTFIRKAAELGFEYVALLLKSTWFNTKRGRELFDWWRPTHRYDLTWRVDFLYGGRKRSFLDLAWFVWVGGPSPYRPLPTWSLIERPT